MLKCNATNCAVNLMQIAHEGASMSKDDAIRLTLELAEKILDWLQKE